MKLVLKNEVGDSQFLVIAYDENGEPFYFRTSMSFFSEQEWEQFVKENFSDKVHIVDCEIIDVNAQQEIVMEMD